MTLPGAFDTPFMQRALLELLLLSVPGGLLGSWVVLRRRAFYTHGVGAAAYPGLVLAGPAGVAVPLAALASAALYAVGLERLTRSGRIAADAATGLLLVAFLALGTVLASDVLAAGAGVDSLLFGSLVALSDLDLWLSAAAAAATLALDAALRRRWLVAGFEPEGAGPLGLGTTWSERALLLALAVAVVVSLSAVGALLVSALFVLPAATARLLCDDLARMRALAVGLCAAGGVAALWLAYALDVGPGPVLAVLGGAAFAVAGLWRAAVTTFGAGSAARA